MLEEEIVKDVDFEPDSISIGMIKAGPTDVQSDPTAGTQKVATFHNTILNQTNEATQTELTSREKSVERSMTQFKLLSVKKKAEKGRKKSKETAEKLVQTEPEEVPKRKPKGSKRDKTVNNGESKSAVSDSSHVSKETKPKTRTKKTSKTTIDKLAESIVKNEENTAKEAAVEKLPIEKQPKVKESKVVQPNDDDIVEVPWMTRPEREAHKKAVMEKLKIHIENFKNNPQTDKLPKYDEMNFRSIASKPTKEAEISNVRKSRTEHSRPPESNKQVKETVGQTSDQKRKSTKKAVLEANKEDVTAEQAKPVKLIHSQAINDRELLRQLRKKGEFRSGWSDTKYLSPEMSKKTTVNEKPDALWPSTSKMKSGTGKINKHPKELGESNKTESFNGILSNLLEEDQEHALFR